MLVLRLNLRLAGIGHVLADLVTVAEVVWLPGTAEQRLQVRVLYTQVSWPCLGMCALSGGNTRGMPNPQTPETRKRSLS